MMTTFLLILMGVGFLAGVGIAILLCAWAIGFPLLFIAKRIVRFVKGWLSNPGPELTNDQMLREMYGNFEISTEDYQRGIAELEAQVSNELRNAQKPCGGRDSNICVGEGCFNEACLSLPPIEDAPGLQYFAGKLDVPLLAHSKDVLFFNKVTCMTELAPSQV